MREKFNPREWQRLVRLPTVIFHAVAMADGKSDHHEAHRFMEYANQSSPPDQLLRAVFGSVVEQGEEAARVSPSEQDTAAYVAEMRALLEAKLSADERRSFLAGLLGLGHNVAAASGGFFGLGNKVSAAETARLEELSEALGLRELLESA